MLTLTPQFAPPQLMADLKKENFSLKLKIYYLETTLSKVSGVEEFDVLAEVRGFCNFITYSSILQPHLHIADTIYIESIDTTNNKPVH